MVVYSLFLSRPKYKLWKRAYRYQSEWNAQMNRKSPLPYYPHEVTRLTLLGTCITLFCTFFCRRCTITTWKCLISRFVEDVNTRQRLSSSLPELRYSLLEFISRKKKLPTFDELNETPSKREKVWDSVTSLFKWRFQRRRRLCCLQSSLTIKNRRRLNRWSVY